MIEVRGLSKTWGQVEALKNVSFTVPKGRVVGFLGANGAGKTTAMDIISGCAGADSGSVAICGVELDFDPCLAKRHLGYLPDVPPLHGELIVADHLAWSARLRGVARAQVKKSVDQVIDRLSLGEVRGRLVGNLSKGFRQRVALAQVLVHGPDVLVLDEPTEGLDPIQIAQMRELIRQLGGDHTVLLSSHILSEVQHTCEEVIIISRGRLVRQGAVRELTGDLASGTVYRLRVGARASDLVARLNAISGVTARLEDMSSSEVEVSVCHEGCEALVERVASEAVGGGHGLRELTMKARSLEEVFLELTR
jgi:ABC-2 type transport system ATP-binding protein